MIRRADLDQALGFALTDEQWAVVSAPMEPAVVVAGAGSGKTTSMSARVAWLIASGFVDPAAVLGLTFTTKAAAQLLSSTRASIRSLDDAGLIPERSVVEPTSVTSVHAGTENDAGTDNHAGPGSYLFDDDDERPGEPQVLTYNAFAARLLTEHGIRLGREPGAQILTDGARQQLAYRVVCRSALPLSGLGTSPVSLTSDLLSLDDQLSELDITPERLIDHEDAMIRDLDAFDSLQNIGTSMRTTAETRRLLARLVGEWRAEKQGRDLLDFTDQTRLALELVRRFPDVAATIRARHGIVLLDEYQDTSLAQRLLLQALFADGHPVTAVGDPCQAIYGWRGASVDNIEQFPVHFPAFRSGASVDAARYTLSSNRRSGPAILAVANDLSADLRRRHAGVGELVSGVSGKGPGIVRVGLFETSLQEKEWIVQQIADQRTAVEQASSGETWSDIAILASTGKDLAELDALLRARQVPTQLYGAAGLLVQPVVVELRSMLEILHNPIANPEMIRVLTGARWAIGVRDIAALGARANHLAGGGHRNTTESVEDALDEAVAGADPVETVSLSDALFDLGSPDAYSPEAFIRFNDFAAEVRSLRRHVGEPMTELITRVGRVTGLDIECTLAADPMQQQYAWSSFLDLAAGFMDLNGGSSLGAFLSRLRDADLFDVDLAVDLAKRANAVQLMTMYKAKGLEFRHVFIPSLAKGAFPGGTARGEWPTSPSAVPWPLRADTNDELNSFPDLNEGIRDKHHKAYKLVLTDLRKAEDERLAYVAMTRAEVSLVVTGHWWGPDQKTQRGPDPYLQTVHDTVLGGAGEVVMWHPQPEDGEVNPSPGASGQEFIWPAPMHSRDALVAVAAAVRQTIDASRGTPLAAGASVGSVGSGGLNSAERTQVEQWDIDAALLLAEARRGRAPVVSVPLPESLSASAVIRAIRDPEQVAIDLARPMPRPPAPAARRGTAFHAWVESRYGQQSLLDPEDLPGSGDEDIVSDEALEALKAAFEQSVFAGRSPVAIEEPFSLVIGGRVVRGRIDAVFESGGRYDVIDWKTGKPSMGAAQSADPYQLALYCIAWSQLKGVPLRDVDAGFFMVASGELIRPANLPDLEALAAQLGAG
jgi:DNA helicase-2/ATP-dependent DNA helicase PcrA